MAAAELTATPYQAQRWLRLQLDSSGNLTFGAITNRTRWPGVAQAACLTHRLHHQAPQFDCACGFYACQTRSDLDGAICGIHPSSSETLALAHVTLWGRIVEHERGLRAEWQQIDRVTVSTARCGHTADSLLRHEPVDRLGEGDWFLRPGCSRCEPCDITLHDAQAQTGVTFNAENQPLHPPLAEPPAPPIRHYLAAATFGASATLAGVVILLTLSRIALTPPLVWNDTLTEASVQITWWKEAALLAAGLAALLTAPAAACSRRVAARLSTGRRTRTLLTAAITIAASITTAVAVLAAANTLRSDAVSAASVEAGLRNEGVAVIGHDVASGELTIQTADGPCTITWQQAGRRRANIDWRHCPTPS